MESMMSQLARMLFLAAAVCFAPPSTAENKLAAPASYVSRQLTLSGAVERPVVLTVEDLKRFPASQIIELVRPARADRPGDKDQKLTGVRLRDVLERAKPKVAGRSELKTMAIVAGASDGYKVVFSWNEVFNTAVGEGVLVYFAKDGAPLGADEGQIALVSVGDLRSGPRHVKWLREVELRQLGQQ
jgi:DMSO/TMAO reductase YedYZ molybdopterin-dependent catalytic subunit